MMVLDEVKQKRDYDQMHILRNPIRILGEVEVNLVKKHFKGCNLLHELKRTSKRRAKIKVARILKGINEKS